MNLEPWLTRFNELNRDNRPFLDGLSVVILFLFLFSLIGAIVFVFYGLLKETLFLFKDLEPLFKVSGIFGLLGVWALYRMCREKRW